MEKTEKIKIIKVGELLKETLFDYRQNWQKFGYLLVIPLIISFVMNLVSYLFVSFGQSLNLWVTLILGLLAVIFFIAFFVFYIFVYIAQFLLINDLSAEVNFSNLMEWLKKAKPYFWRIVAISIIYAFISILLLTPGMFYFYFVFYRLIFTYIVYAIISILGLILLLIPGIFFMVAYAFTVYAGVIDDLIFENSFGYSRKLIKGYWWAVFGRFVVGLLLLYLFVGLISLLFMLLNYLLSLFLSASVATGLASLLYNLVSIFIGLLVGPLSIIYSYKIYISLKSVKGL
jgi:hypothetical protein